MWCRLSRTSTIPKSTTFFCAQPIIEIDQEQLDYLKRESIRDTIKRARFCLHQDHNDMVQEMVIAFARGSYVRPHRHVGKSESFHIIEGELEIVFFDDSGQISRQTKMSPNSSTRTFLCRLPGNLWHTVIPISEFVIIHETTNGPFLKEESEFPIWGPEENDSDGIREFLMRITL